jgi:hypothetical protein
MFIIKTQSQTTLASYILLRLNKNNKLYIKKRDTKMTITRDKSKRKLKQKT